MPEYVTQPGQTIHDIAEEIGIAVEDLLGHGDNRKRLEDAATSRGFAPYFQRQVPTTDQPNGPTETQTEPHVFPGTVLEHPEDSGDASKPVNPTPVLDQGQNDQTGQGQ